MEKRINPENIKPFESGEVSQIKQNLNQLELKKGITLETPPEVYEILGRLYEEKNILVKTIEYIGDSQFTIGFVFPEYKLAKGGLEHVSGVQMTLARFQALYTGIILAIKKGLITSELSYEVCLANLYNVLYRGGTITHKKVLFPGEMGYLTIKINDVIKKGVFYAIECAFIKTKDSFLYGSEKCILEDRFINI